MSERQFPVPPLQFPFERLPTRVGGYDRAATQRLLEEISDVYEALWLECASLREREAELRAELERSDEAKLPVDVALADATESAVAIKEEARKEAELALRKARASAARAAKRREREAKARAEEIVNDARRDRREIELEIERMDTFARETREELSSFLLAALKWYKRGGRTPVLDGDLLETPSVSEDALDMRGELE